MSCPPEDWFIDLLDGQLPDAHEAQLRRHIETCTGCRLALLELVRSQVTLPSDTAAAPPLVDASSYRIERELARGGMGTVWLAHDRRLGRTVAIKQAAAQNAAARARLHREATITARLQHPSIVPVYEAGCWDDGEPFYAMKLVSGRTLADVITETRTIEDRLALVPHVITVAEAAAYAHDQGVIHRDLKPANVLLGPFAETVIVDWGVATSLSAPTSLGEGAEGIVGTPAYMPPEQALGHEVDARADVYSLGATLYHLLSGIPPFSGSSREVLERVIARPPPPLRTRHPGIPDDLAAICGKAMARDRDDRYPSAKELAADLRRFQVGRLVGARHYSLRERAVRWLRRHRVATTAAALVATIVAATISVSIVRIRRARDAATERRDELILVQARAELGRDPTAALAWLKTYPANAADRVRARVLAIEAAGRGVARSIHAMASSASNEIRFSPDGRYLAGGGWLWDLPRGTGHALEHAGVAAWSDVGFAGAWLVAGSGGGPVQMWDLVTHAGRPLDSERPLEVQAGLDVSPDGKTLATVSEGGIVRLWNLADGHARLLGATGKNFSVARLSPVRFSPDGARLATVPGQDGTVQVWDVAGGPPRSVVAVDGGIRGLAWLPDSATLVTIGEDRALRLTEAASGAHRELVAGSALPWSLTVSPDGRHAAVGWSDGRTSLTDLRDRTTRWMAGHAHAVRSVALSSDGRYLASGGVDQTVRLWELASDGVRVLRGHAEAVLQVAFSPDSTTLASRSSDGNIRLWPTSDGSEVVPVPAESYTSVWSSPDARWLASGTSLGRLFLYELRTGRVRELAGHSQMIGPLAFSRDARWLASSSLDGDVRLWGIAEPIERWLGNVDAPLTALDVVSDGAVVAAGGGPGGALVVWETAPPRVRWRHPSPAGISALAFSPDGRSLAVADRTGHFALWDVATGASQVVATDAPSVLLRFSPDGRWLASIERSEIRILEMGNRRQQILRGHAREVTNLAFSPDGDSLVSGSDDGALWIWQVASGAGRSLSGHPGRVVALAFSPDGRWIVSTAGEQVGLWDAVRGVPRWIATRADVGLLEAWFTPDGRVSTFGPAGIRTWPLASPLDLPADRPLSEWLETQTAARIGAADRLQ